MSDSSVRSAVVFTFLRDFISDRAGALQPYLELVSYLWDEYSGIRNRNICIFLAPSLGLCDVSGAFEGVEGGEIFRSKFFGDDGRASESSVLEIGPPNRDEIGYLLERMRIVGEGTEENPGRISFPHGERDKIASLLMFKSREAGAPSLGDIDDGLARFVRSSGGGVVPFSEAGVMKMYGSSGTAPGDPLEELRTTRGWEAVYGRISEIIRGFGRKRARTAQTTSRPGEGKKTPRFANDRIAPEDPSSVDYRMPHFILRGSPGVGKTTVARLIGRILYDAGILRSGHTVEAASQDLVSQYVRESAIKTEACVNRAAEGVLFIDDAYSLLDTGTEHNHSKEAIDALVQILTRQNVRFCLVMAGYPEPMDRLLDMNPGLLGRFSRDNILTIEDYSPEVLRDIFVNACRREGYRFWGSEPGEGDPLDLDLFFSNMYKQRNRRTFANARDVTDLADGVMSRSSARDDASRCITADDFGVSQGYFAMRDVSSIDEIYSELDRYVGLEFVKDLFETLRLEIIDAGESASRGIRPETYPDHYIFSGNPGTGKTTVGRMMGQFYHLMGVLGGAETLFADASDITGTHFGDAKTRVLEKIQEAIDHNQILYIDEAYQIIDSGYAQETVGAMMTKMTENASDFKMIFGMYSNRVEEFLRLNAGLERRLRVVEFPDYSPDQLFEIFTRSVAEQGCTIADDARDRVRLILGRMYDVRTEAFGNAGAVKKFLLDMKRLRLKRTSGLESSDRLKYEYRMEDIPAEALASVEDIANPRSLDDVMAELNEMIGMSSVKEIVAKKQAEVLYARRYGESADGIRPGYYFFVGSAGTGKTTGARLFAECLHRLGVVKTDKFRSVTAKDFIGRYVGETDKKTYDLLMSSRDGTLFIDEAYSLSYADDHSGNSFKKEALEEIIAFIENEENRRRCCIIFAGYPREMQDFYRSNSGLRSRGEEVRFKDYTPEETYEIFELFCRRKGYAIPDGVKAHYLPIIARAAESRYFANARTARTIFERTEQNMKTRLTRAAPESQTDARTITPEDLMTLEEIMEIVSADPPA
jgi:SpoVK/Ycf46/Vps4 family AAA+-type ATPase